MSEEKEAPAVAPKKVWLKYTGKNDVRFHVRKTDEILSFGTGDDAEGRTKAVQLVSEIAAQELMAQEPEVFELSGPPDWVEKEAKVEAEAIEKIKAEGAPAPGNEAPGPGKPPKAKKKK